MNFIPKMNRRSFVITGAAAGGGLAIGLDLPFGGPDAVRAKDGSPEVGAWVVIRPDDTVVVRIARSEMGQGTLTGLCQMVAEELECDWNKVTWEYPTPGANVARNRIWGDYSTGGDGRRDERTAIHLRNEIHVCPLTRSQRREWLHALAGRCHSGRCW